jgi:hypothetical protein
MNAADWASSGSGAGTIRAPELPTLVVLRVLPDHFVLQESRRSFLEAQSTQRFFSPYSAKAAGPFARRNAYTHPPA